MIAVKLALALIGIAMIAAGLREWRAGFFWQQLWVGLAAMGIGAVLVAAAVI